MKYIITFSSPVLFGYATILVDINGVECAIDNETQRIWVNDADAIAAAFDKDGIDPEEYTLGEGSKAEYSKLAKKLAEAEAEEMAEADGAYGVD